MKNNSETGHAKNAANFEKLVAICLSFGEKYNPSIEAIQVATLQILQQNALKRISDINVTKPLSINAIAARKQEFDMLDKLLTRVNNSFIAVADSKKSMDTARGFIRKLQGQRSSPKKTEEEKQEAIKNGKEIVEHSSSQTSFDSRLNNFDKYIQFLASRPKYKPNEEELKIEALTALHASLKAKNMEVITHEASLKNFRVLRNEILYKDKEGLYDVTLKIKAYIKSIYGAQSPQFKQLSSLAFTKPHIF